MPSGWGYSGILSFCGLVTRDTSIPRRQGISAAKVGIGERRDGGRMAVRWRGGSSRGNIAVERRDDDGSKVEFAQRVSGRQEATEGGVRLEAGSWQPRVESSAPGLTIGGLEGELPGDASKIAGACQRWQSSMTERPSR